MKVQTNKINITGLSMLLLAYTTVLFISCSGCKSGKITTNTAATQPDTGRMINPPASSVIQDSYPRIDSIDNIVYVNDSTKIINNVRITYSPNKNETSLLLPNGVSMSSSENVLLLNDIPKNAFKKDQYNYSYIDLRLVSPNIKQKLFGHMSTAESIKMEDLISARYDYSLGVCGNKNNYICKNTTLYVLGYDLAEADNDGGGVGQIGYTEIYDLNGKKISNLNRNKNGGNPELIDDSLNIIIYFREGDDEGNFYGYLWPVIDVYEFTTGKHLYEIRTLGYTERIRLKEGKIITNSGYVKDGSRCFYIIDYKNGQIYFYKYKYGEPYAWSIENDNLILSDGSKTPINNTDKVLKMSIEYWNKYAIELLSE